MTRIFLTSTAIVIGLASTAFAQDFVTRLERSFARDGFTKIEIKRGNGQAKVEAVRDGMQVETVYDLDTEEVVSHEVGPIGDDDGRDDDGHDDDDGRDDDGHDDDDGRDDDGHDDDGRDDDGHDDDGYDDDGHDDDGGDDDGSDDDGRDDDGGDDGGRDSDGDGDSDGDSGDHD
ncbi:PepSY domain-containing protein [Thiosulfatihalobacter marinus]|uniref:PepSY domain-containing protein n=1 Tax=Thiosulfatihalobacter marinus TaxID=2792481 RepID=UPI0018D84130|nr:PepSY domain-containing protein [Thiosulfatihalobacter marinus]